MRDPMDCRMFYTCSPGGEAGQFRARRLACPEGTGLDQELLPSVLRTFSLAAFNEQLQVCVHDATDGPCQRP